MQPLEALTRDARALANGAYLISVVQKDATFQQRLVVSH